MGFRFVYIGCINVIIASEITRIRILFTRHPYINTPNFELSSEGCSGNKVHNALRFKRHPYDKDEVDGYKHISLTPAKLLFC